MNKSRLTKEEQDRWQKLIVSAYTKLSRNNELTDIEKRVIEWRDKYHALSDEKKRILKGIKDNE